MCVFFLIVDLYTSFRASLESTRVSKHVVFFLQIPLDSFPLVLWHATKKRKKLTKKNSEQEGEQRKEKVVLMLTCSWAPRPYVFQ